MLLKIKFSPKKPIEKLPFFLFTVFKSKALILFIFMYLFKNNKKSKPVFKKEDQKQKK